MRLYCLSGADAWLKLTAAEVLGQQCLSIWALDGGRMRPVALVMFFSLAFFLLKARLPSDLGPTLWGCWASWTHRFWQARVEKLFEKMWKKSALFLWIFYYYISILASTYHLPFAIKATWSITCPILFSITANSPCLDALVIPILPLVPNLEG